MRLNGHDLSELDNEETLNNYFRRNMRPLTPKRGEVVSEPFVVSTRARVIKVPAAMPNRPKPWVTIDIAKDARVDVPLDGLIVIDPNAIHESSSVKGEREDEPEGSLIVHRHYAVRKGWVK